MEGVRNGKLACLHRDPHHCNTGSAITLASSVNHNLIIVSMGLPTNIQLTVLMENTTIIVEI